MKQNLLLFLASFILFNLLVNAKDLDKKEIDVYSDDRKIQELLKKVLNDIYGDNFILKYHNKIIIADEKIKPLINPDLKYRFIDNQIQINKQFNINKELVQEILKDMGHRQRLDYNNDNLVNVYDIAIFMNYMTNKFKEADLNFDNKVDNNDLEIFKKKFDSINN